MTVPCKKSVYNTEHQVMESMTWTTRCSLHPVYRIVQDISLVLKSIIELHRDHRFMTSIVRLEAAQMAVSLTELYGLQHGIH